MPNDGFTIHAIVNELNDVLTGGRINKINQPEQDTIIISIHAFGTTHKVLLCCNAQTPRLHLTTQSYENPLTPPNFCNHLRKHLSGATLENITQHGLERIVFLNFLAKTEMFDIEKRTLAIEIMGKHSNIILIDHMGKILCSAKTVSLDVSSVRQIMPGLSYQLPQTQNKFDIQDNEKIIQELETFGGSSLQQFLADKITGMSFATTNEIVANAFQEDPLPPLSKLQINKIIDTLNIFYNKTSVKNTEPCISLQDNSVPKDFFAFPYKTTLLKMQSYPTLNQAVDSCFYLKDKNAKFNDRAKGVATTLKTAISRVERKLAGINDSLQQNEEFEKECILGELLTANLYKVKFGDSEITVENYHKNNEKTTIKLNPMLSASKNVAQLFKKYNKKKRAFEYAKAQKCEVENTFEYLKTILQAFETCTESSELGDIKSELIACGVIKESEQDAKNKNKHQKSKPFVFENMGYQITVGKNNLQNDEITKTAKPNDLWLHVKNATGSHVIIQSKDGQQIPKQVVEYAASLAGFYSSKKNDLKVEVDVVEKRYVKKPPKTNPGFVIFTNQQTFLVSPHSGELKK